MLKEFIIKHIALPHSRDVNKINVYTGVQFICVVRKLSVHTLILDP